MIIFAYQKIMIYKIYAANKTGTELSKFLYVVIFGILQLFVKLNK